MNPEEKLARLNEVLRHAKASPFYRDRLPERRLRSLEELTRIPLTTKEDLRGASPFGLVCVPQEELYQYHESFGTTGAPVSAWLTGDDFAANAWSLARAWGVALNEHDTVLIRFPYAISTVAHLVHAAAHMMRACVIPADARSTVSPFPRVVGLLRKLEVTVLACLPLQAVLIAETAELLGLRPNRDFPRLRAICTGGEPLPPGRRALIQEIWGVPLYDNFGMTEIGAAVLDCEFGRPHPLEEQFLFELLEEDLVTRARPGAIGQLAVTTLARRAAPVIRYLTGDRARLVQEACACGRPSSLEIRGRREHAVTVDGRVLDLWDLDAIVAHLPCRRFWVAGPIPGGLHFVVEDEGQGGALSREASERLEDKYGMKLRFEYVPRGTLYDRNDLLSLGTVGKPQYVYTAQEMEEKRYLRTAKV